MIVENNKFMVSCIVWNILWNELDEYQYFHSSVMGKKACWGPKEAIGLSPLQEALKELTKERCLFAP